MLLVFLDSFSDHNQSFGKKQTGNFKNAVSYRKKEELLPYRE